MEEALNILTIGGSAILAAYLLFNIIRATFGETTQSRTDALIDNLTEDYTRVRDERDQYRDDLENCLQRERGAITREIKNPLLDLARMMNDHLDMTDLRIVAADYGLDWENVKGENKEEKIYSMIDRADKENQLHVLANIVGGRVPRLHWPKE